MAGDYIVLKKGALPELSHNIEDYPDGIVILLDKPLKWTSADAVRRIKFLAQKHFRKKNIKVGHAGTLDPLATGVLLVCIGKATKQAEALQAQQKEYIAEITLGATTPSYDLEKEIDALYPYEHITKEAVEAVLEGMTGEQDQIPPVFSAKLINGTRAYEMARAGEEVVMKPARINIYSLEIVDFSLPKLVVRVRCSKGTYIRSLARDIGAALDSGGHLTGLIRSESGNFKVTEALSMDDITEVLNKKM
ncbi:MAG: tRNA pseudouridine(55) synthase TruB [Bacteroidales bacterium]|nr:tRNA pseudouridine(55) synthase TruB [Bacteroidales bacterium]MBP3343255.1 tRNA pseudouridine(55) synthase TruB [Bacteroidales bacterium]MBQ6871107.1 tRNA pseudouridine(55) synthase TruB [Bacteroidales bacterium]MBQ8033796.1 tRNA pseudouridine(55) synthase TruB [Bacteroidales bacterium]